MKHLKTKLMAAVAMLVVSAVMLTGVSYAWYTLSTNPEVTNIKATAVANDNLEIALDNNYSNGAQIDTASSASVSPQGSTTGNPYTWGNLVDVTNIIGTQELRPAGYSNSSTTWNPDGNSTNATNVISGKGLYTVTYGTDGRVDGTEKLKDLNYTTYTGTGAITTTGQAVAGVSKVYFDHGDNSTVDVVNTPDTQYAFKVVYWLRTNTDGKITLTSATDVADGAASRQTDTTWWEGSGSYIKTAQYQTQGDNSTAYPYNALKVVFHVTPDGGTDYWVDEDQVTYTSAGTNSDTVNLGATIIEDAQANLAYKVEMYVFLDGDVVTNAMAENQISDILVNVQFDNTAIADDGAMAY